MIPVPLQYQPPYYVASPSNTLDCIEQLYKNGTPVFRFNKLNTGYHSVKLRFAGEKVTYSIQHCFIPATNVSKVFFVKPPQMFYLFSNKQETTGIIFVIHILKVFCL